MWTKLKHGARWALVGGLLGTLTGCALDPAGNPTIDVQALGATTLKTIDTPKGPMILRQTRDPQGQPLFQLKFLNSYQLLNFPSGTRLVQFNESKSIAGASFIVFEKTSVSCAHDYMVLIVTPRSVLPFRPQTNCHNDLQFFQRGNDWVVLQYEPRPHYWYIKAPNVDINPTTWEGTPDFEFLSSVPGAPIPAGMQPPKAAEPVAPASRRTAGASKSRETSPVRSPSVNASPAPANSVSLKTVPITNVQSSGNSGAAAHKTNAPAAPISVNLGDYE